jgi:hypothetical protein
MAYPRSWSVIPQMLVRRERWPGGYKAKSIPLVSPDQEVQPDQPVMRMARGGGEAADSTESALRLSLHAMGNKTAPVSASGVAPGSTANETVMAGLRGRVIEITSRGGVIIESKAAVVQGVIGAGRQTAGILTPWHGSTGQAVPAQTILVVPGPLNLLMLRRAMEAGVTGIIASSVSVRDLETFLAIDLTQLLDASDLEHAQAHFPPITLLFTEGLGNIAMPARVMNLLSQYQGCMGLLSGTASARHKIFPELVISLSTQEAQADWHPVQPRMTLTSGAQVRICSGEHEGAIGVVDHLFIRQQVFAAGTRARAARLLLEDGTMLVVPLTLIERVG